MPGILIMKRKLEMLRQKIRIFPPRTKDQSGEEYAREKLVLGFKYGVFALTAFAILRGILLVGGASVTVSSSVDGRELPVYCVDTPEKKIALSFDAAWGDTSLMETGAPKPGISVVLKKNK